jgi:hypothetical protein
MVLTMAALSTETLRGYVLEEILARLIRNTGYLLLVDERQDPDELKNVHNGLAVRGRGGEHQVDVLGELDWIPAFTFPLRLIVEAKARGHVTGIGVVRDAFGVVSDVNQNFTRVAGARGALVQRYSYRYAIFSTSGFSAPAADFALAHQISLVDLSAAEFADLVAAADEVSKTLAQEDGLSRARGFVGRLRAELRFILGTWPEEIAPPEGVGEPILGNATREVLLDRVERLGELFVGMANGPYLLLLRAAEPERALAALEARPVQDVHISWSRRHHMGTEWIVTGSRTLAPHIHPPGADGLVGLRRRSRRSWPSHGTQARASIDHHDLSPCGRA